jgi:hypothetical protein
MSNLNTIRVQLTGKCSADVLQFDQRSGQFLPTGRQIEVFDPQTVGLSAYVSQYESGPFIITDKDCYPDCPVKPAE